jgi:predicted HicB family RNase H-like nuclease
MEYKGYTATVRFSDEDGVFHGKIHGINDLVTFEGSSVDELRKAFAEAVDDYLETCQRMGKNPDKAFKGSFNVRVSPRLHQQASVYAERHGFSLNKLVERALQNTIGTKDLSVG